MQNHIILEIKDSRKAGEIAVQLGKCLNNEYNHSNKVDRVGFGHL